MSRTTEHSVAVIGGSGFVGSSLARRFSDSYDVTVLDRVRPGEFAGKFLECDIRDKQSLMRELNGFSLAINTAIIQVPEINDQKKLGYEVNVLGLQNLCEAVESIDSLKGLLHISSWHVFGERDLTGTLNEEFGSRPDKIDERARLYALCKIAQETIIRIVEAGSTKFYGTIRVGTILGEGMPKQTAANLFIENALHDRPLTPFRHTQYRPMLYVDIQDVCEAFGILASKALVHDYAEDEWSNKQRTINLMWPQPITIIELARMIQRITTKLTGGLKHPEIRVVDNGSPPLFSPKDKARFRVDISRALNFLKKNRLTAPEESLERIIHSRLR